jgi:DNA-binding transcriptional ArsR family regulator
MDVDHVRQITDSKVLAAMSHPLRRRLLDVLKVHGPQPVGALAEHTGQAPANVSHHLRVLAGSGLIVEVPERARDRRERWWRLESPGTRWSSSDFRGDPSTAAVEMAAASLNLDRHTGLARQWFAAHDDASHEWQDAAFSTNYWLQLSPAELEELGEQLMALLARWQERAVPEDGQAREHVYVFAHGFPATP